MLPRNITSPDGLAVPGHRLQRVRVQHGHTFLKRVTHTLPAIEHRALANIECGPLRLPGADGRRAVNLGQAIDVRQIEAEPVHSLDHRRRRSRRSNHRADAVADAALHIVRCVDQHRVHDRRAAVMRHAMCTDRVEHGCRLDAPQADMGAGHRRDGPGKAPAVAVEHRQRPEINGVVWHRPDQHIGHGIRIGAAVRVDDALGIAGCSRRVVQGDRVPLVHGLRPRKVWRAIFEEGFVGEFTDRFARTIVGGIVDIDDGQRPPQLPNRSAHGRRELAVNDEGLRFAMVQHEGDRPRVQPRVERV